MTRQERTELLTMEDTELLMLCEQSFRKGSGNGGQKVNKTSSAVRLFHAETGITVNCLESRSQSVNRTLALKKLRFRIACSERCEPAGNFRLEPAPSLRNRAYIPWIASLFDVLAVCDWDLKTAATRLGSSHSKLQKLLRRDASLWREYLHASGGINRNEENLIDIKQTGKDSEK